MRGFPQSTNEPVSHITQECLKALVSYEFDLDDIQIGWTAALSGNENCF